MSSLGSGPISSGPISALGGEPTIAGVASITEGNDTLAATALSGFSSSEGARGGGGRGRHGGAKVRRDVDERIERVYERILAKRAAAGTASVPPGPKAVLREIKATEPDLNAITLAQVKAAMERLDVALARIQADIANDDEEAAVILLLAA